MMKKLLFVLVFICPLLINAKKIEKRTQVLFETTMGNIKVVLYDETPLHRDNFIKLVKEGFYNGLLFHRVIKDFMIQGGDPRSKNASKGELLGDSSLEYVIPAEFALPYCYHKRGALAMAREGDDVNPDRNSSSCQFYIVWGKKYSDNGLKKVQKILDEKTDHNVSIDIDMAEDYETIGGTPFLDGQYTVFGEVIEGLDVVGKIQAVATDKNDRPIDDVRIIRATVINPSK